MLARGAKVCGASTTDASGATVALNPPVCDAALTSACTIGDCVKRKDNSILKWSDKESRYNRMYGPTAGNWGGDKQCVTADGQFKDTCSTSLASMDAAGKADYIKRMISGCRLGAERSCVDEKFQYDRPPNSQDLSGGAPCVLPYALSLLVSSAMLVVVSVAA